MLRTLLTPLRARFDSPRSAALPSPAVENEEEEELAPEDFARDVLIELMRNAVEDMKTAENERARSQLLTEIERILQQDGRTKDVFREMDGFIVAMSALASMKTTQEGPIQEPEEQVLEEVTQSTRLIFSVVSEAIHDHVENLEYFTNVVGYESLEESLIPLANDVKTADTTMGLLLSFALQDFSVSDIFTALRTVAEAEGDIEATALTFQPKLGLIKRTPAIRTLWKFIPQITRGSAGMNCGVLKVFELLLLSSHRNQAILSTQAGIVTSLVDRFFTLKRSSLPSSTSQGTETPAAATPMASVKDKEKHATQKLLRRVLEMGVTTADASTIFRRVVSDAGGLDTDVLEIVRSSMKSRWLEHFSLQPGGRLVVRQNNMKGLPVGGFTFTMWFWLERLPKARHLLFVARLSNKDLLSLHLHPDGKLELSTPAFKDPATFNGNIHKLRWTHITLVHYPNRSVNPTIRIFVDGVLVETLSWGFPRASSASQPLYYIVGDENAETGMGWCISSAHLLSIPLGDDIPRFIHHLGPRYSGNFQDPTLIRFLTYDAATSLNMFLYAVSEAKRTAVSPVSPQNAAYQQQQQQRILQSLPLMKVVREGLNLSMSNIIFAISAAHLDHAVVGSSVAIKGGAGEMKVEGDVFLVKATCLDTALWRVGGVAIPLRYVQLASTPHELSRAIGVLIDGVRNSWQNSEDMERMRGYDILSSTLRSKSQLINMTGFETLFEFLGISFRSPDQSTVVNAAAYRAIALDFELWSQTKKDIQSAHLEHFVTVLLTSRYRKFNIKQRFAKLGLVRKLLFVLQTDWYQDDLIPYLLEALRVAAQANFTKDDAIRPLVTFLAGNLHEDSSPLRSPVSRIQFRDHHAKAEMVLELLITTLSLPSFHAKFAATLPLTRICLLLLGDKPTSFVGSQILRLIASSVNKSVTFSRKFELISGWSVLKTVLPACWDPQVNEAAFDVLLGRSDGGKMGNTQLDGNGRQSLKVVCPAIVPAILAALRVGLGTVALSLQPKDEPASPVISAVAIGSTMEVLVEQLMDVHSSSASFREIFESHQNTQLFVDAYKSFVTKVSTSDVNPQVVRLLEKLGHFGLALALDTSVAGSHKREILDAIQKAESTVLSPASSTTLIDPHLVADTRTIRQRLASARLSIQVGERAVIKTITRMVDWRKTIQTSEQKRLRKNILDLKEHNRQIGRLNEWTYQLTSERGLWPLQEQRAWRLDETEGPHRIRKKLEPENDKRLNSRVEIEGPHTQIRNVEAPDAEDAPAPQVEVPPWNEAYEISSTDIEERQLAEDIVDDKHRRVRHELEPGDVIEAVTTVARIAGVDSSPGLLIVGKTHLYMLDGLVENDDGEVVDAHDAPKHLFFVPGSIVELDGPQRAQRWPHDEVATFSNKTFLFRDVALEIYFKDSRSLLVVFLDKKKRLDMDQRMSSIIGRNPEPAVTPGTRRTPMFGKVGGKFLGGLFTDELSTAQRKWQAREISNYTYLSIINQISGRTPSDATQYPIFPWVLQDYTSSTLDLNDPEVYRDLGKPMGALNEARREAAETRYQNLESVGEDPFHYGTHFSSSMMVCHFLIRMSPFTHMFKTLQGGDWDLPDRLFIEIPRAYDSAARDVRGDVRELIPEFFNCPEFLENYANLDFGVLQNTGEKIHDVKLPPWARNDPLLFVILMRRALESQHVSEHLPEWIDLIWGYKQRDTDSCNVFHPLSYEGSIDLDSITDDLEREATVGIIHNFGQTPRKLFTTAHPPRYHHGLHTLPIGTLHGIEEDPHLLEQQTKALKDLGSSTPVNELVLDFIGERILPCPDGVLSVPHHPHEQVEWGFNRAGADELWVVVDGKVTQAIEGAFCTCAAFADSSNLVTGSSDHTVRLWRLNRGAAGPLQLSLSHIMRSHTERVVCVTASRAWSMVVSGSNDGSAGIWDLNRGVYVRSIWHKSGNSAVSPVHLVAINESTGYIATCSRTKLCLHTINARPMAVVDLTGSLATSPSSIYPAISSLAFHEREYSHLGILATGEADGTITLRTWTSDGTPEGERAQWEFLLVRSMKVRTPPGATRPPAVTALKFIGESLVHGEETGKSFMWSLPDV